MSVNSFKTAPGDSWQAFKGEARVTHNVRVITWCLGKLLKPQPLWQCCLFLRQWKKEQESTQLHAWNSHLTRAECWISPTGVMRDPVEADPWLLCLYWPALLSVASVASEDSLPKLLCQAQTSDMSLWRTCEQQKSWSFFFESSSWVVTHLIRSHTCISQLSPQRLCCYAKQEMKAAEFLSRQISHKTHFCQWNSKDLCISRVNYSETDMQTLCNIDVPNPSHSYSTSVLFTFTQLCVHILVSMEVAEFPQNFPDRLFSQLFGWLLCYYCILSSDKFSHTL